MIGLGIENAVDFPHVQFNLLALPISLASPYQNKGKFLSVVFYKVSVRSLFIFAIRAETLRSIVRSPISTTSPPRISEFTWKIVSYLCKY